MSEKNKKVKILVIQLARMGDVLQTTPVLFGLRQKYPNAQIDIVVRKSFKDVLNNNPFINKLFILDSGLILENLLNRKGSLVESMSNLKELINDLSDKKYDMVFNLTFSLSSSYLAYIVNGKKTYGLTRSSDGYYTAQGEWSKYFVANVIRRGQNIKHVVDLFKGICDVEDQDTSLYMHVSINTKVWVKEVLNKTTNIKDTDKIIALQPGASKASKRWCTKNFAKLIDALSLKEPNLKFVVLGSVKEKHLAENLMQTSINKNIYDFTGKTNLEQLAALLSRSSLLISNDTGTLHVATSQDVPVVCISTGASNIYETGPYSFVENYSVAPQLPCYPCDYSTKCTDMKCQNLISVDVVLMLASKILFNEKIIKNNDQNTYSILTAKIQEVNSNSGKKYRTIKFKPLFDNIANTKNIMSWVYKSLWDSVYSDHSDAFLEFDTFPDSDTQNDLSQTIEVLEKIYHLTDIGDRYSELLLKELNEKNISLENIKALSSKLQTVDENIEKLGELSVNVIPLINKFKVDKESLEAKDLAVLALETKEIYSNLATCTQYIFQILMQIMGEKNTSKGVEKSNTEKEVGA